MKRILSLALFAAGVALLGGCPVYADNQGDYRLCDSTGCYRCPTQDGTYGCQDWTCGGDQDCPGGYWCNGGYCQSGVGVPDAGSYTPDATAPANCAVTGCDVGFVCELLNGTLQCVPTGTPTTPDAGTDTGPGPADAGDAGVACQSNADCAATPGAICLDGTCVPPTGQCFDQQQCPPGDRCVQGACTPTCNVATDAGAGTSCPTGYGCAVVDDASSGGVCTGNPTPCEADAGACASGTVCSQNHCVPPCGPGGACPTGEVCLQGGCVPNQIPHFFCANDGVQDACATGSICLHHSCYIGCNPEAGAAACQSAAQFNQCKPVTTSNGTYDVCGSSTDLGNECNPTSGQLCPSGGICIDGYCH